MSNETHKILCMPTSTPQAVVVPGSVRMPGDCGHEVWIAPSGVALALNPAIKTEVTCLNCIDPAQLRQIVAESGLHEVPGAREELEVEVGKEVTDRLYQRLGVKRLGE